MKKKLRDSVSFPVK